MEAKARELCKDSTSGWTDAVLAGVKTADRLELWGWLKEFNPPRGYAFYYDPTFMKLYEGLEREKPNYHSGGSLLAMVQTLSDIAKMP